MPAARGVLMTAPGVGRSKSEETCSSCSFGNPARSLLVSEVVAWASRVHSVGRSTNRWWPPTRLCRPAQRADLLIYRSTWIGPRRSGEWCELLYRGEPGRRTEVSRLHRWSPLGGGNGGEGSRV